MFGNCAVLGHLCRFRFDCRARYVVKLEWNNILKTIVILKFIYFEKATNVCKISIVDLSYVVTVKSTVEILQDFVGLSEYMNFS